MKLLFVPFLLLCLYSCKTQNLKNIIESGNRNFTKIYPYALRGDLEHVLKILDTIPNTDLNKDEIILKKKYYARFRNNSENFDYKTSDSTIIEFVDMFHTYWKSIMIDSVSVKKADSLFIKSMARYLLEKKDNSENISLDSIQKEIYKYSNAFINSKGYYSNAFGKTGHLYDLFLWKKEEVINYPIELIDNSVNVTVHLMDDMISTGWSHYTTFGRSYASGWATREALYCIVSAYDISSENFKVSYLTHEGQHFSDYIKYPKLGQRDLEYRAKLTELVKSEKTTHKILGNFSINAFNDFENAHAFANYCIIRDLTNAIFKTNLITDKIDWHLVDSDLIKEKSLMLFHNHTKRLDSIGKNKVTGIIN